MKLERYKDYWTRPGTLDQYIVDELGGYKVLPLKPTDIVLDVGGCIGTYSRYAAGLAKQVVVYEPMPDNFKVLKKNTEGLENVEAFQAALHIEEPGKIQFYVNEGTNKGAHTMIPTRGRTVLIVNAEQWRKVMVKYKPTKIKMDCEGAEYTLLREPLNKHVRGLVMEYHLTKRDHREQAQILHEHIIQQGFECIKPPTLNTKAWTAFASYVR